MCPHPVPGQGTGPAGLLPLEVLSSDLHGGGAPDPRLLTSCTALPALSGDGISGGTGERSTRQGSGARSWHPDVGKVGGGHLVLLFSKGGPSGNVSQDPSRHR